VKEDCFGREVLPAAGGFVGEVISGRQGLLLFPLPEVMRGIGVLRQHGGDKCAGYAPGHSIAYLFDLLCSIAGYNISWTESLCSCQLLGLKHPEEDVERVLAILYLDDWHH
jgi:hypothetical protein